MITSLVRPFAVIADAQVHRALDGREKQAETVRACYRLAGQGFLVGGYTGTVVGGATSWLTRTGARGIPAVAIPRVRRPGDPGAALGDEPEEQRAGTRRLPGERERNPPRC